MEENNTLDELKKQDWDSIIPRATNYVQKRLGTLELIKGSKQFARGSTAKEVTFKAIELLFDNTRNWNRNIHPDLYQHIISTINSLLSEHFGSFENRRRNIVDNNNETEQNSFWDNIIDALTPEEIFETKEIENQCLKIVEDDDELTELYLYVIEDFSREEIAKKMNKPMKEIDNMKKRLRRKLNNELHVKKTGIAR